MSTISNKSPETTVDRLGGDPVVFQVTWTAGEKIAMSYFKPGDLFRMVVKIEDPAAPGTYLDIGPEDPMVPGVPTPYYCWSGIPGQPNIVGYIDPQQSAIERYEVVSTGPSTWANAPVFQRVKMYMPKVQAGVYYVQLEYKANGAPIYTSLGSLLPMWCQEPCRFDEGYSIKGTYPEDVYLTGAQSILEGGV